jgi:hypothetical protein
MAYRASPFFATRSAKAVKAAAADALRNRRKAHRTKTSQEETMLNRMLLSAALFASASVGSVMAQESAYFGSDRIIIAQDRGTAVPSAPTQMSMFCKTSAGGPGFVLVTLTNMTNSNIPKGQALFARKGGETIKFEAAEAIPQG